MSLGRSARPLFWVLGLVLLAGSLIGASHLMQGRPESDPGAEAAPAPAAPGQSVVCFGQVDVEFGVTPLIPAQPGRVVAVLAEENKPIKAGEPILRLDDRLAKLRVEEAKADLKAAEAQLTQARLFPEQHRAQLAQQRAALDAMRRRLAAAGYVLTRKQHLESIQQLNPDEVRAAQELVLELEAGERAEKEKLRALGLVNPQVQIDRAEADVSAKRARLHLATLALDECAVKAPEDGVVLRILVSPGTIINEQSRLPAALFCSARPRIIRAEVEQEFAGRVHEGQKAWIEDDSAAQGQWTGKVVRIADWYTQRRLTSPDQLQYADARSLECIIALDPNQPALRLGQRVRVTLATK